MNFRDQAEESRQGGRPTNLAFWAFLGVDPGPEIKDLLNGMLDPNADTRMPIEEVLAHPWLAPHEDDLDAEGAREAMRRKMNKE